MIGYCKEVQSAGPSGIAHGIEERAVLSTSAAREMGVPVEVAIKDVHWSSGECESHWASRLRGVCWAGRPHAYNGKAARLYIRTGDRDESQAPGPFNSGVKPPF